MITSRYIVGSMDDFIQGKQVDKAVPFYDPLKRPKLKALASDGVIKKDNVKSFPLLMYFVKLHMLHPLISTLVLETV